MSLVELIDADGAPLLLRDLYAGGDPGPIVGALAQVPELCEVALPFIGKALGASAVSARYKEFAILRTSALLSCRYCVDAHTVVALDCGLTLDEVRALRGELVLDDVFARPEERAVLAWIDAVATGTGPVPAELGAELARHVADHIIVELTVTIGTTMLLNRMATALELPTSPDTLQRLAAVGLAAGAAASGSSSLASPPSPASPASLAAPASPGETPVAVGADR
ncbi:MAG: carboxymuconolactone decarboxylase family protein [Acidimicrobiia bacterium]|nr:carboxymuconolactone decarboxylase family protein [Acidimicrobiia bacterium]